MIELCCRACGMAFAPSRTDLVKGPGVVSAVLALSAPGDGGKGKFRDDMSTAASMMPTWADGGSRTWRYVFHSGRRLHDRA